jgi:hypothetical protein
MVNTLLTSLEKSKTSLASLAGDPPSATSPIHSQTQERVQNRNSTNTLISGKKLPLSTSLIRNPSDSKFHSLLGDPDEEEEDRRFDHQESDSPGQFTFDSDSISERRAKPSHPAVQHTTTTTTTKFASKTNPNKFNGHQRYQNDTESLHPSETSDSDRDWPPPQRQSSTPQRGFIPLEERLKPQTHSASASAALSDSIRKMKQTKSNMSGLYANMSNSVDRFEDNSFDMRDGEDMTWGQGSVINERTAFSRSKQPQGPLAERSQSRGRNIATTGVSSDAVNKKAVHTLRMARGMPRIVRLCLANGPLIKVSYEDQ